MREKTLELLAGQTANVKELNAIVEELFNINIDALKGNLPSLKNL